MRLHALLASQPVTLPPQDPEVKGIRHDSRRVEPGDLFVAIVGEHFDGRRFAADAARRGAVAVLGPGPVAEDVDVPWVETPEPRRLVGPVAARLYGMPHERLLMIGVTGTNGKSTVTALVAAMLERAGLATGTLGTLGFRFRDRVFETTGPRTTPEASDFFGTLDAMAKGGARAVAAEISSHALALGRVEGAKFDVAVFTNLTRDHLDLHGDLESYYLAKRSLFDKLKDTGRAVVSSGDVYGRRLAGEIENPLTFGPVGEVTARSVELDLDGTRGTLLTPRGPFDFRSPLLGRFNLDNLLAAVAAAEALELDRDAMAAAIRDLGPIRGRLERVGGTPVPAFVDYAHTPAALEAALRSLAELTDRRIALVFGCGGDRDRGKRAEMGEVAGKLADLPIATSDNPRSEDPRAILAQVVEGLERSGNPRFVVEVDRRDAIRRAVEATLDGGEWTVLLAGKGHEEVQIVGGETFPFSDRQELARAFADAGRGGGDG